MMLPTHALVGMALALPVALAVPEFGGVALAAGFLGGAFPDLDLYVGHRKTLHYPVYYSALVPVVAATAALVPAAATVGAGAFLLAAAAHSVADVFGGGLELRPWEGRSRRAVYDHHRGRWIAPRAWVPYDGAPRDALCAAVVAVPLLAAVEAPFRGLVAGSLAVALVYAAVRRALPAVAERLVAGLPAWTRPYLPDRYTAAE